MSLASKPGFACVVTTIQPPTAAVEQLHSRLEDSAILVVVGDRKGPDAYPLLGVIFMSLEAQLESEHELARILPVGHYARKNLGYLEAIRRGATCIYETDDDNAPLTSWARRAEFVDALDVLDPGWVNAYRSFSEATIWPRGFPLQEIRPSLPAPPRLSDSISNRRSPIQQALANGSPDVDAVWRLVCDSPIEFVDNPSIHLPRGSWCPFNSQSTWWWPVAFPLLYLPSHCSFRMTDIWRSFVAQRCLWELGLGLTFHAAEVVQDRNEHDLMRDFVDEIPGYRRNVELVQLLEGLELRGGVEAVASNLRSCYEALVSAEFVPAEELQLVDAWLRGLVLAR